MIQKSILKSIQFLHSKLTKQLPARLGAFAHKSGNRSIGIAQKITLGVLMASLFLPVFLVSAPKSAQAVNCSNVNGWTNKKEVKVNKNTVAWDEPFDLFMAVYVDEETFNQCKDTVVKDFKFSFYIYHTLITGLPTLPAAGYINTPKRETVVATKIGNEYAFAYKRSNLTLKSLNTSTILNWTPTSREPFTIFGYFALGDARDSYFAINFAKLQYNDDKNPHEVTDPNLPDIQQSTTVNTGEDGILFDSIKYGVGIQSRGLDADKYRNFLRVTFADGGWVAVSDNTPQEGGGQGNSSLLNIPAAMAQENTSTYKTKLVPLSSFNVEFNMSIMEPDGIVWSGSGTSYISYSKLTNTVSTLEYLTGRLKKVEGLSLIAVEKTRSADKTACGPLKYLPQQIACSESKVVKINPDPSINELGKDKKPFPLKSLQSNLTKSGVDNKAGKVYNVLVYPTLDLDIDWKQLITSGPGGIIEGIANPYGFSYTGNSQNIFVEVFASKEELEKHKDDAPPAEVTPYEEKTSVATTSSGNGASDLFAFLRKVVAYIILLITSTIYWIFAIILVPILNALLQIRPYQDEFVNFIYPGWVILRNVANIGFIIALLWMGLRVLFQVDDSGKTRGFIMWLVIMALLVNFSLVIGQGVVGIADTVQAQFLPGDSRVIEALGHKLMVDPIKLFGTQSQTANLTPEGNEFSASAAASDITKPFVMLILAVAAFFAFIALIAFILVRLVALWILYMLAPVAYVARILPDTKQWWDKWWSEFIKYAFTVPILAFFLNITALMATTFALRNGDSVIAGRDRNYILGPLVNNAQAEIVEYAVTVISHFIVLVFLFIGMKFAMSSGHAGAEKIVGAAKKGFDFVTKTAPMAAKNWASGKASDALDKRGYTGLSKGLAAITNPKMFGEALKKKWLDDPKALREANQRRRIGDIKYLTRSDNTAKALDNAKLAQKDFDSEASGYLQAKMREGDTMNNRYMTQGAMLSLAKNKNFDEIVKSAEDITGKKFGRDAAGLNAAVKTLAKKQGWTGAEEKQMIKTLDHMAGVDNKIAHYSGNAEYDSKKKEWKVKDLDPQADPNNSNGQQRLAPDPHKEYVTNLVKRRGGKSMVEDAKTFSADSMVEKDPSGNITGWTDTQVGVMAGRDLAVLSNRDLAKKFKETDNYQKIKKGYEQMGRGVVGGSRQALINKMQNYQNRYVDPQNRMSIQEITAKANLIDSNFMSGQNNPQGGNQPGGGNNPNNPPTNPQGGNQPGGGNNPNNPPVNPGAGSVINIPVAPNSNTAAGGGLVNQYGQPLNNPIFRNQLNNTGVRNIKNSNKRTVVAGNTVPGQKVQNTPTQSTVSEVQKVPQQNPSPTKLNSSKAKNKSPKIEILKPLTSNRSTTNRGQAPSGSEVIQGRQADKVIIPQNPITDNQSNNVSQAVDSNFVDAVDTSLTNTPIPNNPVTKSKPTVKSMSKRELIDQRMKHYRELKDMESQNSPKYENDIDRLRLEMRDLEDEIQNKEDKDV